MRNFKCKETEKVFNWEYSKKLPSNIQKSALERLMYLDAATVLEDLRVPPSNHLEKLTGKRKGQYSIRVNKQWRICFKWKDDEAVDVEIVDYH